MNNPHDKLFKAVFSEPDVVASLIEDLFPPELAQNLDTSTLVLANGSFVDEELTEHFADLVFDCQTTDQTPFQLALLLEHKSYTDPNIHLQLLRYLTNRWQEDIAHERPWTPILPVVIYHGAAGWKQNSVTSRLAGMTNALQRFVPEFDYLLVDLSELPDERIARFRNNFLRITAFLFKWRSTQSQYETLLKQRLAPLLAMADARQESRLEPLLIYVAETGNLSNADLILILRTVSRRIQSKVMTTAERWRMEGRMEGRMEVTNRHIVGLIRVGMAPEAIATAFEMTVAEVRAIIQKIQAQGNAPQS